MGTVTGWGATGAGDGVVNKVPADIAMVVPATIPIATPLPRGG